MRVFMSCQKFEAPEVLYTLVRNEKSVLEAPKLSAGNISSIIAHVDKR